MCVFKKSVCVDVCMYIYVCMSEERKLLFLYFLFMVVLPFFSLSSYFFISVLELIGITGKKVLLSKFFRYKWWKKKKRNAYLFFHIFWKNIIDVLFKKLKKYICFSIFILKKK